MARKSSKTTLSVSFKGVEGRTLVDEGEVLLKTVEVSKEKGDKGDYLKWVLEVVEGKQEGSKVYHNTSLTKQSLWNLKTFLEALGVDVPDDDLDLDLAELADGLEMMGVIEHELYKGQKQARLVDFYPAEEGKSDKKGKKGAKDEGPDEDEINDMDEEDLAKLIKKRKLDIDVDDFPKVKKLRAAVIEALADAGEAEEKDDKKSSKKKGKKKDKVSQEELNEMNQEELEDFCKENDLDVDFDDYKTIKKMRGAVIDAAEKEDLLEE